MALPLAFGNPKHIGVSYNADQQTFKATLTGSRGGFSKLVATQVPLAEAPKLKGNLLSEKVVPSVSLVLPSFDAGWALYENAVQCARRFADASDSSERWLASPSKPLGQ